MEPVIVIGAGLAGSEAAWQLARRGVSVTLREMKPAKMTPAHHTEWFGELVCSNSLRSDQLENAVGLLKEELRRMDSLILTCADAHRVEAGGALAVDRHGFARAVTEKIRSHPLITVEEGEVTQIPESGNVIVASGPLTSDPLAEAIRAFFPESRTLNFYDAAAPLVTAESVDMDKAWFGSRYDRGTADYVNCPMTEEEYDAFWKELTTAQEAPVHGFEDKMVFEGCMPVEALAARGEKTLAFGPLKPVGFTDPRTGRRPFALLQLRPENGNKTMFNLVGCQTKLTYPAQAVCFRKVPGLEHAEFVRFGSMHRNTYVNAPVSLNEELALKSRPNVHLAGQITGVEGYVESIACGLWVGQMLAAKLAGRSLPKPPATTALGALLNHLSTPAKHFQPSNVHFGLMPEPEVRVKKKERKQWYADRARAAFGEWLKGLEKEGD